LKNGIFFDEFRIAYPRRIHNRSTFEESQPVEESQLRPFSMAKKKKSSSHGNKSPTAAASTTTTTGTSNNTPAPPENIQVHVSTDLIRDEVQTMMMQQTDAPTETAPPPQWVGAIDQGTSSTRFMVFQRRGEIVASAQLEHEQFYPQPGWHEHDPMQLWHNTMQCMTAVYHAIQKVLTAPQNDFLFRNNEPSLSHGNRFLAAVGITNQRETVIAWNRTTGRPYYNAIVWDDARTASRVAELASQKESTTISAVTGLPLSTYFTGTKVHWLLENVEEIRTDLQEHPEQVCFGTVDAWLLFQFTGQVPKSELTGRTIKGKVFNTGGVFQTDVTNASRWLFMDLKSCQWDPPSMATILAPHSIPYAQCLPEICPSSHPFGAVHVQCGLPPSAFGSIPITAILGDQQAALFGQAAHTAGTAKNTYGTGLFLMMNTGTEVPTKPSTHGLITTVAYQIGRTGQVYYALEGSVSHSGSTIQWLRDQLGIIVSAANSETLARTTANNEGLYFVPAFSGLLAPHWRTDARGCIVGITALHHRGHLCRAALEATAYQTKDVFDAIVKDTGIQLSSLNVDGGGTYNKLLMEFQADILNVPVVQPKIMETTSIGVAFAAGLAVGVWKDVDEIQKLWSVARTYKPKMSDETRAKYIAGWKKALTKSFDWIVEENGNKSVPESFPLCSSPDPIVEGAKILDESIANITTISEDPSIVSPENHTAPSVDKAIYVGTVFRDGISPDVHEVKSSDSAVNRTVLPKTEEIRAMTPEGFSFGTVLGTAVVSLVTGILLTSGIFRARRSV
jgi:glycerol kinase